MSPGRRPALAAALLVAALVAMAGVGPIMAPVAAASQTRVGLVIDTGDGQVKTSCVTFAESTITGAELLRRADVDAVFSDYGGQGTAVCSLCRTGCPANDCLTCDPKGRYWAYFRAPWGSSNYQYSRAGAHTTTVRDGDVEAWGWGSGRAPAYISFADLCGGPAPTRSTGEATSTTTPSTGGGGSTTTAPKASGPSTTTGRATTPSSTVLGPTGRSATSTPPQGAGGGGGDQERRDITGVDDATEPANPGISDDQANTDGEVDAMASSPVGATKAPGAGSRTGLIAALAVVGGLGGWAAWLRRRRGPGRSSTLS